MNASGYGGHFHGSTFTCPVCGADRYQPVVVNRPSRRDLYHTEFFECCGSSAMFRKPDVVELKSRGRWEPIVMCGRYVSPDQAAIEREWHIGRHNRDTWITPRFNIAPTSVIPVILFGEDDTYELASARWGLIPTWWKKDKPPALAFNARSEEAAVHP